MQAPEIHLPKEEQASRYHDPDGKTLGGKGTPRQIGKQQRGQDSTGENRQQKGDDGKETVLKDVMKRSPCVGKSADNQEQRDNDGSGFERGDKFDWDENGPLLHWKVLSPHGGRGLETGVEIGGNVPCHNRPVIDPEARKSFDQMGGYARSAQLG